MKNAILTTLVLLLVTVHSVNTTHAQSKNALGALAVSPDNSMLIAAGYNRVMYVCDPADMSVKNRIYLGIIPYEVFFSKDGGSLVMFSSDRMIHVYDTSTWKRKADIQSTSDIAVAPDSDEMVVMHGTKYSGGARLTPVAVYDMATGQKKREATFEFEGSAIGTNSDGTQFAVLSRAKNDETEKKEKTPKEMSGAEKDEFELKHDGRTSEVLWLDKDLKETNRNKTWYSDYGTNQMLIKDGVAHYIVYRNRCGMFTPEGETSLFKTGTPYNYGIGISSDGKTIASGGLSTGMLMNMETKTSISFKHSRLQGFPEYFYGFTFGPDGTIYGGTNAWRIIKVSPDGEVQGETPIF